MEDVEFPAPGNYRLQFFAGGEFMLERRFIKRRISMSDKPEKRSIARGLPAMAITLTVKGGKVVSRVVRNERKKSDAAARLPEGRPLFRPKPRRLGRDGE